MKTIEEIYNSILGSDLFRLDGEKIDCLSTRIIALCNAINAFEGETEEWIYLGESGGCYLCDFIAGAYWSFSEWHAGQNSIEYAALCALGSLFSPGMTREPEAGEAEWEAYNACNEWFQAKVDEKEKKRKDEAASKALKEHFGIEA